MTKIEFTATLTEPLHHGAGTSGNTSLLRTQDVILPDGRQALVPFLSGNSLRHWLRSAIAWDIATHLNLPEQSLPKRVVDLLWSGGAITSTGAETNLDVRREIATLQPHLALMGYSAGSDITAGTLHMPNLHLVCAENAWRLPARFTAHPLAKRGAGSYRGEEFGTRHDVTGTAVDRYVELLGHVVAPKTTQMIYDMQVVKPGAILTGTIHLTPAANVDQKRMLAAGIDLAAPRGADGVRRTHLGAKAGAGYGACVIDTDPPFGTTGDPLDWWHTHLDTHRDAILHALAAVTV